MTIHHWTSAIGHAIAKAGTRMKAIS